MIIGNAVGTVYGARTRQIGIFAMSFSAFLFSVGVAVLMKVRGYA